jgi:hypothetical protein
LRPPLGAAAALAAAAEARFLTAAGACPAALACAQLEATGGALDRTAGLLAGPQCLGGHAAELDEEAIPASSRRDMEEEITAQSALLGVIF